MDEERRRQARAGLRDAPERAGARAHFRAMGIDPARLDGPIVGIASTWTGTMPCNVGQLELSARATAAIDAAGGVPLPFNTIAVSDNQSQGTPGMRASLISREVIADSIELMVHAHDFDAVVCIVGLRQDRAGGADGARARRQAGGRALQRADARRAGAAGARSRSRTSGRRSGAFERGAIARAELDGLERDACPGPGTCAGHFTANTMADRARLPGRRRRRRRAHPRGRRRRTRRAAAERAGRLAVALAESGPTARAFLDRRALLNAMAGVAATGGSTNGVLHLLAIAIEAGVAS